MSSMSSSLSGHGGTFSTHNPTRVKNVIVDVGADDPVLDSDDFQDVRMEINANSMNLTSVVLNPRDTFYDEVFNEFHLDQVAPLEYVSPAVTSSSHGGSSGKVQVSSNGRQVVLEDSNITLWGSKSSSSSHAKSVSGTTDITGLLSLTAAEVQQLDNLTARMRSIYANYERLRADVEGTPLLGSQSVDHHSSNSSSSSGSGGSSGGGGNSSINNSKNSRFGITNQHHHMSAAGRYRKQAADELRFCYREVPEMFFRTDFFLFSEEVFYHMSDSPSPSLQQISKMKRSAGISTDAAPILNRKDAATSAAAAAAEAAVSRGNVKMMSDSDRPGSSSSSSTSNRSDHKRPNFANEHVVGMSDVDWNSLDMELARYPTPLKQDSHTKLSVFLDYVEIALLRQIWVRSPSFFKALDNITGLQFMVTECTKQVKNVRLSLQLANEASTADPIRVPKLQRRRNNSSSLMDKLSSIQQVYQSRAAITSLLEVEDYLSALDLIAVARELFHQYKMQQIVSMRAVGAQLDELDTLVCEVMCNKFVSLAIQWEADKSDSILGPNSSADILLVHADSSSNKSQYELDEQIAIYSVSKQIPQSGAKNEGRSSVEISLRQLLTSLVLSEKAQSALNMYKSRLLEALRLTVRTCVMEYLMHFDPSIAYEDQEDTDTDTPFAQKVKAMSPDNFISCIAMCYEHVTISLTRAQLFNRFIASALDEHISKQQGEVKAAEAAARASSPTAPSAAAIASPSDARSSSSSGSIDATDKGNHVGNIEAATEERRGNNSSSGSNHHKLCNEASLAKQRKMKDELLQLSKACLAAACDLAQRSVAQLFNMRKESNAKFAPEKMKITWELSLEFVLTLEDISGATSYVIRQCLLSQTKQFLEYLHETCKGRLVNALDNERWTHCDVTTERQADIDRLVSGKSFLPAAGSSLNGSGGSAVVNRRGAQSGASAAVEKFRNVNNTLEQRRNGNTAKLSSSSSTLDTAEKVTHSVSSTNVSGSGDAVTASSTGTAISSVVKRREGRDSRPVMVENSSYKVVWCALLLCEIIFTYLDITVNFSPVTAEVATKIAELIRLFDSRTKNLVLGAQAIQSAARLKSISAKHLATTGQSVNLLVALLPHIRASLLSQIPSKHHMLLSDLERVSQELLEHHGQIVDKFVSIVNDFIEASAQRLRVVDWDRLHGPCEYFEEVSHNVSSLHRVLLTCLPAEQIQDVFSRIFALLNRTVPQHFEEVLPNTLAGRQRILDEITHLVTSFSRLKQVDASALNTLEESFKKKYAR